jgi:hypothetical protein
VRACSSTRTNPRWQARRRARPGWMPSIAGLEGDNPCAFADAGSPQGAHHDKDCVYRVGNMGVPMAANPPLPGRGTGCRCLIWCPRA